MKRIHSVISALTLVGLLSFGHLGFAQERAMPTATISYQGKITLPDGSPVHDGEYPVTVTLYGDETGARSVWQDTYTAPVVGGVFSISLGGGNVPLPASAEMDRPLWVGVRIAGGDEMRPLTRMSAAPYALNVPGGAITAEKIADGAVTAAKMNTDYVSEILINGEKVTGKGTPLNLVSNGDIDLKYDRATGSLRIGATSNQGTGKTGAATLAAATDAWAAGGDAVNSAGVAQTVTSGNWLGTSGTAPSGGTPYLDLDIKVNSTQVMKYQPNGASTPNIVGGWQKNVISLSAIGSTIAGGGDQTVKAIAAGDSQTVLSSYGFIGGGRGNTINDSAHDATIGGGIGNVVNASTFNDTYIPGESGATIGGGGGNIASGYYATIAGGHHNEAPGNFAFVGGGGTISHGPGGNHADGDFSSVVGGLDNGSLADYAAIGGGTANYIFNPYGTIAGGSQGLLNGDYGYIGGGDSNIVYGDWGTVGGGRHNTVAADGAVIGGGDVNTAEANWTTVGGGEDNHATANHATIGGGHGNTALGNTSAIVGGYGNITTDTYAGILAGQENKAGEHAAVGGGYQNDAYGSHSFIGSGYLNVISSGAIYSVIGSGSGNTINRDHSAILGGEQNIIDGATTVPPTGTHASILGGDHLTAQSYGQVVCGIYNQPKGSVAWRPTWATIQTIDEPIFIVGNGSVNSGVKHNGFEVSYNGHSVVYDVNHPSIGGRKPIGGATYQDNILYAWGYIGSGGAVMNGGQAEFGITAVTPLAPAGIYKIEVRVVDDGGNPRDLSNASVTATIVDENYGTDFLCAGITTSPVTYNPTTQNNEFIVKTGSTTSCTVMPYPFMFKMTGRPATPSK